MDRSKKELAEERARQLDNKIISLCVVWILLSIALVGYDSFRNLIASDLEILALPVLSPTVRVGLRIFALMFYLAAWRIVLKENPKDGRGLLIGFGVFYVFAAVVFAFIKTLIR